MTLFLYLSRFPPPLPSQSAKLATARMIYE